MPNYIYQARNLQGEATSGTYEAPNYEALEYMLREKGFFITGYELEAKQFTFSGIFKGIGIKDIAVFCRQFAVIINAGITIVEAVSILSEQSDKKKMSAILVDVHDEVQKGKLLSAALAMYPDIFPEFMLSMVRVGEASGSLDSVMSRLADYYERENRIRSKIRVAMTYPIILAVLTVGVVTLLMVKVLPMFAGMLSGMGGELPLITQIMMGISSFMVNYFAIIGIIIAALIGGISYFIKTPGGEYLKDGLALRIPIVSSTTRKVITSRFARSLGILLKSGIPIIQSIDIISDLIGNTVVEERFKRCRDEVREGRSIAPSVERVELFPPLLIHMIAVGERTGELDEMLLRTAGFFDEEVEEAVEKQTAMIQPLMILVLASIVGGIIASVMLPMVSLMSSMG